MLFDTHAHMDDRAFDADREALLSALPEQGIGLLMNPGCSLVSSRAASALASRYDYIYAAVGSHPDAADEVNDVTLEEYRTLCKLNPKIKAIGEIGLDYHYEDIPRERQQAAFRAQMALALELNLPVIVHEREAHEDGLHIVEEFPEVTGVFHCYSGSAEMAKWLIARGWYIGFTGVLTFKNARKAVETAAAIPLDRIVLETDCPYMSPEPFRGKRNDPGKLYRMAERLAEIRGISVEEVHAATMENGKRLYRIYEHLERRCRIENEKADASGAAGRHCPDHFHDRSPDSLPGSHPRREAGACQYRDGVHRVCAGAERGRGGAGSARFSGSGVRREFQHHSVLRRRGRLRHRRDHRPAENSYEKAALGRRMSGRRRPLCRADGYGNCPDGDGVAGGLPAGDDRH